MMPVREDVEMDDGGMILRSAGRWPIGYRRHAGLVRPFGPNIFTSTRLQ